MTAAGYAEAVRDARRVLDAARRDRDRQPVEVYARRLAAEPGETRSAAEIAEQLRALRAAPLRAATGRAA